MSQEEIMRQTFVTSLGDARNQTHGQHQMHGQDKVNDAPVIFEDLFRPQPLLRNGTVQTLLSAFHPAQLVRQLAGEELVIVDGGIDETGYADRVQLFGYYNRQRTAGASRGLVISLHGWEGCSHSIYNLAVGAALLEAGYDLFRLNIRDHGPQIVLNPYALNRGVFMATLLREVHCAAQQVAQWAGDLPVFLMGASLGGNYVLRMTARHAVDPIHNLRLSVAVSPAINPLRTSYLMDAQPHFRHYFRARWAASLAAKAAAFPELYDFGPALQMALIRPMTEWLVTHYTPYASADEYFRGYAVSGDALAPVITPTTILSAMDDPVISVDDFAQLAPHPLVTVKLPRYGGHVGFMDFWPLHHVLPRLMLDELAQVE
jgi:predicted alpha/beta-fold hydrolase